MKRSSPPSGESGARRAVLPRRQSVRLFAPAPHQRRQRRPQSQLPRFRGAARAAIAAYASVHSIIVPDNVAADGRERGDDRRLRRPPRRRPAAGGRQQRPVRISRRLVLRGRAPAWSNATLRDVLREHGQATRARSAGSISTRASVPGGMARRSTPGPDDAAMIARTRAWYGCDVTTFYDGSSTSAALTGVVVPRGARRLSARRIHRHRPRVRHATARGRVPGACAPSSGLPTIPTTGEPTAPRDQAPDARRIPRRPRCVENDGLRPGARGGVAGARAH